MIRDIIFYLFLAIVFLVFTYLFFRIGSFAIFKSYFQTKKEEHNDI